jgi:hypothetical protein
MTFQNRLAAAVRRPTGGPGSATLAANNRWASRKPANTPAKILFDGITTPFECSVRDISSTGAQIEMARTKLNPEGSLGAVPNEFTLLVTLDRTAVECRSMWRRGSRMGVRFLGMVRQLPPAKPPMIAKAGDKKGVR